MNMQLMVVYAWLVDVFTSPLTWRLVVIAAVAAALFHCMGGCKKARNGARGLRDRLCPFCEAPDN